MEMLLAGELGRTRIILLRIHGPVSCIPGFGRLRMYCIEHRRILILVSGTGEIGPDLSQTVNVSGEVIETASRYLDLGGISNLAELCRYLSDRLLLTGLGYEQPKAMPEHGIYLPRYGYRRDRRLGAAGRSLKADGSRAVLSCTSHERQHCVRGRYGTSSAGTWF